MSRGLLGADDPLFFRQARKAALKEADLIILAGAVCDFRLDYGRSLGRKALVRTRSYYNLMILNNNILNAQYEK